MIGRHRNFGLDVMRAVSIILVLIAHRFTLNVELGIVGVQIFFLLSGFLIGQILIKDFTPGAKSTTIIEFWKRRWFRTLPLYYLILVLKIIIFGNPYGWKMIVYFLFLQANFVGIDFFGVTWSLVVEEWFYIFLPLFTLTFFKRGIDPKKWLVFIFFMIMFFFMTRFLWNYFQKGVIIYQFDCLLLGVLLASLKIFYPDFYLKLNSAWLFLCGLAGIVILTIVLGNVSGIPLYATFYRVSWYFLISICIAALIPFIERSAFLNTKVAAIKPLYLFLTWTSILSYSIYLLHMDVFGLTGQLSWLLQVLIIYAISFVIYALYEKPAMSLRDDFSMNQYLKTVRSFKLKI